MFHHQIKHFEDRQKYSASRRTFNSSSSAWCITVNQRLASLNTYSIFFIQQYRNQCSIQQLLCPRKTSLIVSEFVKWNWQAKNTLTSNICLTNLFGGYTCTAGSKAVDSSHTETKRCPSSEIKGKGRRIRVCDILNVIKHVRLIRRFLLNNKLCDGSIVSCSSNPGKRCSAFKAICYGKICWRIRNTYKNQI